MNARGEGRDQSVVDADGRYSRREGRGGGGSDVCDSCDDEEEEEKLD